MTDFVSNRIALLAATVALCVPVASAQSNGNGGQGVQGNAPYAIGLWGDLPYSTLQAQVGVPNLIADMNAQHLAFTVHDGDLKSGSSECKDSVYTQALSYFNSLSAPAAFTPGDNDWVDCDRTAGYSSLAQLDKERALFFSTPYTLGQKTLLQEVQSEPLCLGSKGALVPCVENRRWTINRVTYVTLNIQGSCNNLCDTSPDPVEYQYRNAANIAWLQDTFAKAKADGSVAVMIISQADPGFDQSGYQGAPKRDPNSLVETDGAPDGFHDFLVALQDAVVDFKKPVAYVHGDSHYFMIDKPLHNSTGLRLENFTRVETFGDNQGNGTNDSNWVKVLVDPGSREVFAYQPQIVPGNRVAVPAP